MTVSTRDKERAAPGAALPRAPIGPRILGAVLLLVGLFLLWEAFRAADGDFSPQGPWLTPVVVTGGWVAVSLWYLVAQFVSPERPEPAIPADGSEAAAPEREDDVAAALTPEADAPAHDPDRDGAAAVPGTDRPRWLPPALLAATLCGYLALLEPLGFVLASAVFFMATARILGSRKPLRDIVVAAVLPLAIHLAFTRLLELHLPTGVLPL